MASVTITAEEVLPDIEELFLSSPVEPRAPRSSPLVGISSTRPTAWALQTASTDPHVEPQSPAGAVDNQEADLGNEEKSRSLPVPGTESLWIRWAWRS